MSHPKDQASTLPERAPRLDATIVVPTTAPASGATSVDGTAPLDSYQPPAPPSTTISAPSSKGEFIVPSTTTVGALLAHVRKPSAERLVVEARVAAGGMGVIDVAIDRALDRRIAIKTLHPHLRSDEQAVRMFLREARLTGLLDHPYIVPVYDLGERDDGHLFFAMKLVEGQTLADLIRALPRGALDTATLYALLDVVAKVCDALAFAHSRGVLHCDIKPANVMVGEFGQIFLMDWGVARLVVADGAANPATPEGTNATPHGRFSSATDNSIIGTACCMSPEQARGDRRMLDVRSDVFLLGAMLYELLTHRPPYVSGDRGETLALAAACAFPSPRKIAGEIAVPIELDRIVMRAMAKAPGDRYPSVAAFKEDLVRFMRGGAEFPRRVLRADDVIVKEGDPGDAAYIIVDGRCDVRKDTPAGTQTMQTIGPGDVFGEMAILTQGPRTATVVATEQTTVLVVTADALEQELEALKPWMATLLKSLASRFRDADTQARATYSAVPSPAHIANLILMNVATWGADTGDGGRSARWSEIRPDLEDQLGMTADALARVVEHYGLTLDLTEDLLTIAHPEALRARIATELGKKSRSGS